MGDAPATDPATRAALQSLSDIVLPSSVPWWPQTWGWALLAFVLVGLIALTIWRWLRARRRNGYRREALALLTKLSRDAGEPDLRAHAARDIAELLKRVMLAAWPRVEVASLSGEAWVRFLSEHGGGTRIADDTALWLSDGEYHSDKPPGSMSDKQFRMLADTTRTWVEKHRVPA